LSGKGERVEPGPVSAPLMQLSHDEARQKKFELTPRELEIVSAVVAGHNKEIAGYF